MTQSTHFELIGNDQHGYHILHIEYLNGWLSTCEYVATQMTIEKAIDKFEQLTGE